MATNTRPITLHHVKYASRETRLVDHFGKERRAQRGNLAWFENHCAANTERRHHLECDLVHRPIPWGDQRSHANGFVEDCIVWCMIAERTLKLECLKPTDDVFDVCGAGTDLRGLSEGHWSAHLHRNRLGHFLATGLVDLEQLLEQRNALALWGHAPRPKRGLGRSNRSVGVSLASQ